MEFSSPHPFFTLDAVHRGLLEDHPFVLIDAGCSGGISPVWRRFEPHLRAVGIDPVVTECERLTASEHNPHVRYIPAFVGLPADHPFNLERRGRPTTDHNPWNRLSAARATELLAQSVDQAAQLPVLNTWQQTTLAKIEKLSLTELASREGLPEVDFIKIDIDGHDLEALHSAKQLIQSSPVLGLVMEVNFYGGTHPAEHTFHNTDRLMREWGFDLFGLTVRKYSSAAMPNRFEWDCPAQAVSGRPYQGDALYLRDIAARKTAGEPTRLPPHKLLKLACLFECLNLADFAAELIELHSSDIGVDRSASLDLLIRNFRNDGVDFETHMRRFRESPSRFYRNGTM